MKRPSIAWLKPGSTLLCMLFAGAAQAHTGHGTSGLVEGLNHPLGMDHLLAMVAVGVWSVSALPADKAWWGPATFMSSLVLSAMLGAMGVTVPFIEHLVSLSVVMFGAMLVFSRLNLPAAAGLSLVALVAAFHGLAHGAEAPESGFATYALGFLLTTALLHFGGVYAALGLKRFVPEKAPLVVAALGALCAGAGAYLLSLV